MAEAAVEERPPPRFYCHVCKVQFENASTNFTCPHCSAGFIEELQNEPQHTQDQDMQDYDDLSDGEFEHLFNAAQPQFRRGLRYIVGGRRGRPRSLPTTTTTSTSTAAPSNARQPPQNIAFENLIQDFIVNLGVGLNWGAGAGGGNVQLLLGNPGDYAWGREGLDAIITQLLNQMDSTGPPPVSADVIDSIPLVKVSPDQVGSKLQCSVCWENFTEEESVRQLPCQHVYHDSCIRPWLGLHGTCPICRQNLMTDDRQMKEGEQRRATDGNNEDTTATSQATLDYLRNAFSNGDGGGGGPSTSGGFH